MVIDIPEDQASSVVLFEVEEEAQQQCQLVLELLEDVGFVADEGLEDAQNVADEGTVVPEELFMVEY